MKLLGGGVLLIIFLCGWMVHVRYVLPRQAASNMQMERKPSAVTLVPVTGIAAPTAINNFSKTLPYMKLDPITKRKLLDATMQTCVVDYHRESCVYYLIVCGDHCKKLLTPDTFEHAKHDYWILAAQAGIKKRRPLSR